MRRTLLSILLCTLAFDAPAAAPIDLPAGVPLSSGPVLQQPASYATFTDRQDGIWGVYQGEEPGAGLFAQHLLSDGSFASGFGEQAMPIASRGTLVNGFSSTADGVGGAIVMWFGVNPADSTSPFLALRCQHIDSQGIKLFPDTGIVVSSIATAALVVSDGSGGAYVVWEELKGVSNPDIVAQHYDAGGAPLWTPSGSPTGRNVCAVVGLQRLRALHEDGAGGAYVVWADSRTPSTSPLYAMRLTPSGVAGAPWTTNGVRVSPVTSGIRIVGSAPSPSGGLWLAWRDINVANQLNGQHVSDTGTFLWGTSAPILTTSSPVRVEFVPATAGDVFLTWTTANDVRCQRMSPTGTRLWIENLGRVLITPSTTPGVLHTFSDGAGGLRVLWSFDEVAQPDVNLSHFDGTGAPAAGETAIGVSIAATTAAELPVALIDGSSGSRLVSWLTAGELRVRRLVAGTLGVGDGGATASVRMAPPAPNPSRTGQAPVLRFTVPAGPFRLALYDASGRRVLEREGVGSGGPQSLSLEGAAGLPPGVYSVRLQSSRMTLRQRLVRVQ